MNVHKKTDTAVVFFISVLFFLCFTVLNNSNVDFVDKVIHVFHFSISPYFLVGIFIFFALLSLLKTPFIDNVSKGLLVSVVLGTIPLVYAEHTISYIGNYFPLIISFVAYFCCVKTKVDVSSRVYLIFCIVCCIISIQVIQTEIEFFSGLSFGNFGNVSVKGFMNIPIGSSNLIAAILLPLLVFIVTLNPSKLTLLIAGLTVYALLLCRSKNALSLMVLIVFLLAMKKVYLFIIKDESVYRKTKLTALAIVTVMFIGLFIGILNIIGFIVTDLQFEYHSPYSNAIINYLDTVTSGRIVIIDTELKRVTDHLFLGNGYGYNLGQSKSHNWLLDLLVQRGVMGFIIYIYCIVSVFKIAMQNYKTDRFTRASVNLLCVVFIQGLLEISVFTIEVDFIIWSIAGFLIARKRYLDRNETIVLEK